MAERYVLFVGTRQAMDRWMHEHRIHTTEAGRSVFLALNGPEHLRRIPSGPVKVVHERGWTPGEGNAAWAVDAAITLAQEINGQLVGTGEAAG